MRHISTSTADESVGMANSDEQLIAFAFRTVKRSREIGKSLSALARRINIISSV